MVRSTEDLWSLRVHGVIESLALNHPPLGANCVLVAVSFFSKGWSIGRVTRWSRKTSFSKSVSKPKSLQWYRRPSGRSSTSIPDVQDWDPRPFSVSH
jgi:hypothetical protein